MFDFGISEDDFRVFEIFNLFMELLRFLIRDFLNIRDEVLYIIFFFIVMYLLILSLIIKIMKNLSLEEF